MKTIGKAIRCANVEKRSWKQEMYGFLRNYRATPHRTTGISPAELMFGRKLNTKLPKLNEKTIDTNVMKSDKINKEKMKSYADRKNNAKPSQLKVGDTVLVKQEKKDKLTTPFNPKPMKIVETKGTMITAKSCDEEKQITRNSSHFKQVKDRLTDDEIEEILDSKLNKEPETELRRSARVRIRPSYLKDYVCNKI